MPTREPRPVSEVLRTELRSARYEYAERWFLVVDIALGIWLLWPSFDALDGPSTAFFAMLAMFPTKVWGGLLMTAAVSRFIGLAYRRAVFIHAAAFISTLTYGLAFFACLRVRWHGLGTPMVGVYAAQNAWAWVARTAKDHRDTHRHGE